MEDFQQKLINFKNGIKISDLIGEGVTFDIDTAEEEINNDDSNDIDFSNYPGSEDHIIPIDTPFHELKNMMELVIDGVWKKVYKAAKPNAQSVDFSKHRVTYHRNLYMEVEAHPFDSTWLNQKPAIINPYETHKYLEGILDALGTMKEGEQSYFIIDYRKMFKEQGCEPRVAPYADIFCDLKVLKVEEIGDQTNVEELNRPAFQKTFQEAKEIYNDGRLRAKNLFQNQKYDAAIKMYEKIAQMLDYCKTENDNEIRERKEMMTQNFTNMGTCYNIREEPNKTMSAVRQIENLVDISKNPKILFIKGKALRMNGDYKNAAIALERAHHLAPNNSEISIELQKLDKSVFEDKKRSKNYEKLFK